MVLYNILNCKQLLKIFFSFAILYNKWLDRYLINWLKIEKYLDLVALVHRPRRNYGSGVVRKTIGAISRPALTYVANRIADMISGEGIHKRRPAIQ